MTVIEISAGSVELTFRQRWSHYFVMIFGAVGLLIGLNLRDSVLYATTQYTNPQAGITAEYPQNWLLDEGDEDYVFRAREVASTGYNTTLQVAVRPVSAQTTARNIFDSLSFPRAQTLAAYQVIAEQPYTLPDGTARQSMTYTYVATQTNPFLQSLPLVVEGIDILIIDRGQAIIVSYLSGGETFDTNLPILERFLSTLEF